MPFGYDPHDAERQISEAEEWRLCRALHKRHISASLLNASGLDIAAISRRLGHSKVSITSDIYAHTGRTGDKQAAEILGKIIDTAIVKSNNPGTLEPE